MAKGIMERHGATPYGFRFSTRGRSAKDLDSKVIKESPMHYIGGKIRTFSQVKKDNLKDEDILRSNMECNGIKRTWQATKGWKCSFPLEDADIVLSEPQ